MSRRRATLSVIVIVGTVLPFVLPSARTIEVATVGAYLIAIAGLDLLLGEGGYVSLGHGAFMGIGAYTTAILMLQHGVRDVATIPAAGAAAGAVGLVVGLLSLRLGRSAVAVATFALAIALPSTLARFDHFTGGPTGLSLFGAREQTGHGGGVSALGLRLGNDSWVYVLTWAVAVVVFALGGLLARSGFGRQLRAARDNELGARAAGVPCARNAVIVAGVSAAAAGVAGGLLAILNAYVSPQTFPLILSLYLLAGAAVAGLGSLPLALGGAVLVQFLPDVVGLIPDVRTRQQGAPAFVLGALLVVVVLVVPTAERLRGSIEARRR